MAIIHLLGVCLYFSVLAIYTHQPKDCSPERASTRQRMNVILYLVLLCKICGAGWPCCLRGEKELSNTCVLDLSSPNEKYIHTSKYSKNGVKCKRYFPREGINLTSVVYKSQVLWTDQSGSKCVFVQSYAGKQTFLTVGIYNEDKYEPMCFRKRGRVWREMDLDTFNNELDDMMRDPYLPLSGSSAHVTIPSAGKDAAHPEDHPDAKPGLILDLANPDCNIEVVQSGSDDTSNYRSYRPVNTFISSVIDSGTKIWEARPGERCEFATLNFKKDHYLLALDIPVEKSALKYFEKDGTWKGEIPQDDFLHKLCEMRQSRPKCIMKPTHLS